MKQNRAHTPELSCRAIQSIDFMKNIWRPEQAKTGFLVRWANAETLSDVFNQINKRARHQPHSHASSEVIFLVHSRRLMHPTAERSSASCNVSIKTNSNHSFALSDIH